MKSEDYLGRMCEDIVTKQQGICICYSEHLFGCDVIELEVLKDGDSERKNYLKTRIKIIGEGVAADVEVPKYAEATLLGAYAKDKITEFEGVLTVRYIPLFAGEQYLISGDYNPDALLRPEQQLIVDEGRLEIIETADERRKKEKKKIEYSEKHAIPAEEVTAARPGGPVDSCLYKKVYS